MVDFSALNKINLFYTLCIFVNHFAFGISSTVLWPALVDLSYIYDCSNEAINYLVTFSSLGYLLGSLSGALYKWLNRQLTIVVLVAVLAVTTTLVPFYGRLWALFLAITLNGIGGGTWDSNNNVWIVEMWPAINAPLIQASQFFYGLGTIVGPIIVSPYVHGENGNSTNATTTTTAANVTANWTPEERKEQLTLPFGLTGAIQIVGKFGAFYFSTEFQEVVTAEPHQANNDQPSQLDRLHVPLRPLKLLLMALCLATYDAAEIAYFYFSPTMYQFMTDGVRMTAEEAAHVLSVLSAAYTVGRLVTAFVAIKLKPDVIISYHFLIIIAGHLVLYTGRHQTEYIYAGTVVLGFGFSAMWPAILAFTDRYLALTNRVGSLLFFFAGVVSLFTPFIIGRFLQDTPLILFAFEGVYILAALVLFILLRLLIGFRDRATGQMSFSILIEIL
ncbi:hypothetical protein TYRP_020929 [Tyrophagus putrescentiae]|nr:hypothetical protein TYRP_020929 [Tyrophagus putrescentiae]